MARLVLATRNRHKVVELRAILAEALAAHDVAGLDVERDVVGVEAYGLPDVVESGVTFAENAVLKARFVATATGRPAVADDSGIAVDVLGGAPGVFSARWAGRHGDDRANLELLLAQLSDVPDAHRGAAFVCAAALVTPDGAVHVEEGRLAGTLERAPRGHGGFGYDPVLRPHGSAATLAELSPEEKNAISHRGRAFRALAPHVVRVLT
jgi:XTP/dITP diphosphohydrolase